MSGRDELAGVIQDPYAVPCPSCMAAAWTACSQYEPHLQRQADAVVAHLEEYLAGRGNGLRAEALRAAADNCEQNAWRGDDLSRANVVQWLRARADEAAPAQAQAPDPAPWRLADGTCSECRQHVGHSPTCRHAPAPDPAADPDGLRAELERTRNERDDWFAEAKRLRLRYEPDRSDLAAPAQAPDRLRERIEALRLHLARLGEPRTISTQHAIALLDAALLKDFLAAPAQAPDGGAPEAKCEADDCANPRAGGSLLCRWHDQHGEAPDGSAPNG